jgi:hypothetical protein
LPSHVTHSGKDKFQVHSLLFSLSLKELKSDLSGLGSNQILLESFDSFLKSSKVDWFILNVLDFPSSLDQNLSSHPKTFPVKVHLSLSKSLILIFIH